MLPIVPRGLLDTDRSKGWSTPERDRVRVLTAPSLRVPTRPTGILTVR